MSVTKTVRIELTKEQYRALLAFLRASCPSEAGLPETCGMPTCEDCWDYAFKPKTIPDKGKEG